MDISVMVAGLPGNMGRIVAETCMARGLKLVPWSLTGEDVASESTEVNGISVSLLKPSRRDGIVAEIKAQYPGFICIDYTHPSAVNGNAEFYVRHGVPFVMGTTGGDREALDKLVRASGHPCVIAPNMAKQIVALQTIIEYLADNFPTAFDGYKLSVVESHQKTKADTSGTAKAIVASFQKMGLPFGENDIEMVRNEPEQLGRMQVPAEYLGGHAFHTYSLDSADGTVHFEFRHNVCGRKVYAEGTVDAVVFLAGKIASGEGRLYNMMDVLRSGAMR